MATARVDAHALSRDLRGGAPGPKALGSGRPTARKALAAPTLIRARGTASAQTTKLGGRALPPAPLGSSPLGLGRNVRPTDLDLDNNAGPPGIRISMRISADHFAEGINTLTLAVIPGGTAQRVEHVLSFLWQPAPARQRGPIMPGRLIIDSAALPAFARDNVGKHFGKARLSLGPAAAAAAGSRPANAPLAWAQARDRKGRIFHAGFPTRAIRVEAAAKARAEVAERMHLPLQEIEKLRMAISKKALRARPAPLPVPMDSPRGDDDGHAA